MTDTVPAAVQAPALTPELQTEVLKLVRLAIADPGHFTPRNRAGDGETPQRWAARAVVAALGNHPIVAIRPDRPTQWAYDQACAALEKHRQRADKAEARLADLGQPPSDQLPDDRDGMVRAWFELYLRWKHQAERAERAEAERDGASMAAAELRAERDTERAEADQLRYERRLLGFARMTLDLVAAGGPDRWDEARHNAEDVAQRIVDEIGHPVTDEPALGPSFREELAALREERDRFASRLNAAQDVADGWEAAIAEQSRALGEEWTACLRANLPALRAALDGGQP